MKKIFGLSVASFMILCSLAQKFYFPRVKDADTNSLSKAIPSLAGRLLISCRDQDKRNDWNNRFRLQILAGKYVDADSTIDSLRHLSMEADPQFGNLDYVQHKLYVRTRLKQANSNEPFNRAFEQVFVDLFTRLDDRKALRVYTAFLSRNGIEELHDALNRSLSALAGKDSLTVSEGVDLCNNYYTYLLYKNIEPIARQLLHDDDRKRYTIEDSVLITTKDHATLSAVVVRKKDVHDRLPAALVFTIYSDTDQNLYQAKQSAVHGYVGVVADSRGKRLSPDSIAPYEHEASDVNAVIDWISKQAWSNGSVGMYGGSYNGFSQWAATKHVHPALKTIVPYVAAIPGFGLPMENNVFLNANYGWAFYVTNNKYLDNKTYNNPQRWNATANNWYTSGVSYRKLDSIDGTPNPWLQRWLQHPSFDRYWQAMIPFGSEFAHIHIPVLTITGYYDDGQISALWYMREHYKYDKTADHYLIIGPYDHFGAQRGGVPVLRDYKVDSTALIDTREITYQWLDYVLKSGRKPAILKNKINYEVMGRNEWLHSPSLEKMHNGLLTFYLSTEKSGNFYKLSLSKPTKALFIEQQVDLADRKTSNNNDYYPFPIIEQRMDTSGGLFFLSEPLTEPLLVSGAFAGTLRAAINKKDMDVGVTLFEVMPDGTYFHLSYYLGRASYSRDMTKRLLLTPGKIESIPFDRSRVVCRQLSKGSRLLVIVDINKNSGAQVNYGTGKDVSDEDIRDATVPLQIKWYNDSVIRIPIWR